QIEMIDALIGSERSFTDQLKKNFSPDLPHHNREMIAGLLIKFGSSEMRARFATLEDLSIKTRAAALMALAEKDLAAAEPLALQLLDTNMEMHLAAIKVLTRSTSEAARQVLLFSVVEKKIWETGSSKIVDGSWTLACEAIKTLPGKDIIKNLLDLLP